MVAACGDLISADVALNPDMSLPELFLLTVAQILLLYVSVSNVSDWHFIHALAIASSCLECYLNLR